MTQKPQINTKFIRVNLRILRHLRSKNKPWEL